MEHANLNRICGFTRHKALPTESRLCKVPIVFLPLQKGAFLDYPGFNQRQPKEASQTYFCANKAILSHFLCRPQAAARHSPTAISLLVQHTIPFVTLPFCAQEAATRCKVRLKMIGAMLCGILGDENRGELTELNDAYLAVNCVYDKIGS